MMTALLIWIWTRLREVGLRAGMAGGGQEGGGDLEAEGARGDVRRTSSSDNSQSGETEDQDAHLKRRKGGQSELQAEEVNET